MYVRFIMSRISEQRKIHLMENIYFECAQEGMHRVVRQQQNKELCEGLVVSTEH